MSRDSLSQRDRMGVKYLTQGWHEHGPSRWTHVLSSLIARSFQRGSMMLGQLIDHRHGLTGRNRYHRTGSRPFKQGFFSPRVERLEDRRLLAAITSMIPAPGSTIPAPGEILIEFDAAIDPATVTGDTFSVMRSGGDGTFGDGNEVEVPGNLVTAADGLSATYEIPSEARPLLGAVGGVMKDVAMAGDLAYVADIYGLKVYDLSDPSNPVIVGAWDSPGQASGVHIAGTLVYLADGDDGLVVIDVSDPTHPRKVGHVDIWGRVDVSGSYAYVAAGSLGMHVIDVSDPADPVSIGVFNVTGHDPIYDVVVAGNYAYFAFTNSRLRVVDISDPANPREVSSYQFNERPLSQIVGLDVVGTHAYVVDENEFFRILDVSDPLMITPVATLEDIPCNDVFVVGDLAYVSCNPYESLRVIDVSDPANPTVLGKIATPGEGESVAVLGGIACVADGNGGLRVIDVSQPENPLELGSDNPPGALFAAVPNGDYVYAADFYDGLLSIDVSDPGNPRLAGRQAISFARDVEVSGDYAYVVDGFWGLRVVDIRNPADLTEVGFLATPGAIGLDVIGDLAYVAAGSNGFRVINVSDPANPVEVGYWDPDSYAEGVAVAGDHAFVADRYEGLCVIDVSDPAAPFQAGVFDSPGRTRDVTVSGPYAYLSGGDTHFQATADPALRILDVSDPSNPIEVGHYDTVSPYRVSVSQGYAYLADGTSLRVFDVRDPTRPTEVGVIRPPGHVRGVSVSGSLIFVAAAGLRIHNDWPGELPADVYRITLDGTDDVSGAIKDAAGNPLDGEGDYIFPLPVDSLPSGDGTPGGDAVLEFRVVVPGPRVKSMTPAPGGGFVGTPTGFVVGFDSAIDPATVTGDTFRVLRSGGDGSFGDGNDVTVTGNVFMAGDGSRATFHFAPGSSPGDVYRVWLDGTDDANGVITDMFGNPLDGEGDFAFPLPVDSLPTGDGVAGGDAVLEFTIRPTTFTVTDLTPTSSGFVAGFSGLLDPTRLSLYDVEDGTLGPADLTLVDSSGSLVPGSLVAGADSVTFVATGGPLPAGDYNVTLRAAADSFLEKSTGELLDGNADGTPGDDYTGTFTIAAAPAAVLQVPDFARGPGQQIRIPAGAAGLPLALSDAAGVTSVDVVIEFDPTLLSVTGAAPAAGLPADAQVTFDTIQPGQIAVSYTSGQALPAGPAQLIVLDAEVPPDARYGAAHVIDVTLFSINGGTVASTADDAIHVAAYFGDTTGNQQYSGLDAQRVSRIVVQLDIGFEAYPLVDPVIIADVTGNGTLSGLDAQRIAQKAVGLAPAEIPPVSQPLRLDGPRSVSGAVNSHSQLRLTPVAEAALVQIAQSAKEVVVPLTGIMFEIVDLPRDLLGLANGQAVQIDIDAAGHGWFIDTLWDDVEYYPSLDVPDLIAVRGSLADRRVDLMTAVLDAMGHVLGYDHEDDSVMDDNLPLGIRRLLLDDLGGPLQHDGFETDAVDHAFGSFQA